MPIYTRFYIYAYLRTNGTPYYIGKGQGRRAYSSHHIIKPPKDHRRIIIMESNLTELGALALERFYIKWYGRKSNNTGILHNFTDGGEGMSGYKHTNEAKAAVGKANSGTNSYWYGKKRPEHSEFMKQQVVSDETREKLRISASGSKNGMFGKSHTQEHIDKLSKEYIITNPEGEVYVIKNLRKFCRDNNLDRGNLQRVAKGKTTHCKGWKMNYLDPNV